MSYLFSWGADLSSLPEGPHALHQHCAELGAAHPYGVAFDATDENLGSHAVLYLMLAATLLRPRSVAP